MNRSHDWFICPVSTIQSISTDGMSDSAVELYFCVWQALKNKPYKTDKVKNSA